MRRIALHWQILVAMVVGAGIGLLLNWQAGNSTVTLADIPQRGVKLTIRDSTDRTELIYQGLGAPSPSRYLIDGAARGKGGDDQTRVFQTLDDFAAQAPRAYAVFRAHGRSPARRWGETAQALGGLFLRLLKMVAVPLIVASLSSGVMGLGSTQQLGRMFGRTIAYYLSTSMLAIGTGLLVVNVIQPGLNGAMAVAGPSEGVEVGGSLTQVLWDQLHTLIPTNPIGALSEPNFLSIISFTLMFSVFTLLVGGKTAERLRELVDGVFEVMMAMTSAIIRLAPAGVLFLMLYVTATQGAAVFESLARYMVSVTVALSFHALVTLPLIVWFVARRNPLEFARAMSPALLTAFSSASSNGTLPLTLANVEQRAGINNRVSSFVLPLGATINMDGTALYEVVAVLFIAQVYHGENLEFSQQLIVAFTALLASIGAAGIPHAGLVMMVIILQALKLPVEMQGIILAVDRVLDMYRTCVNVWSDACGCTVVARFEPDGELHPKNRPVGA